MLHRQALGLEAGMAVEEYDKLLQGIEYASGVRRGPVPQEITDFYKDALGSELEMGRVAAASTIEQTPARVRVEFQNMENRLRQAAFAQPGNWGKTHDEIDALADATGVVEISQQIPPYALATADRVIDPLFRDIERTGGGHLQRADLILVDGKTIRETMQEQFTASGRTGSFDDFYRQNANRMTNELVAAGLMAGKRVEAFVPNKYGEIPKEPTQITKTGYEPSPLKPEHFNAWQRHFAKRGFYQEKVARQAEYERLMAARDRVRGQAEANAEKAGKVIADARLESLHGAIETGKRLVTTGARVKGMFFGRIMAERADALQAKIGDKPLRAVSADDAGRPMETFTFAAFQAMNSGSGSYGSFTRSEPVDTCIGMLLAQGHDIHDIMDPAKLQTERDAAAREFMEHAAADDQEWLGRVTYHGHMATLAAAARMTQGQDITGDAYRAELPYLQTMLHSAFSTSQKLATPGCREGYLMEACKEAARDKDAITDQELALGSARGTALDGKINDCALLCDELMTGLKAEAQLAADPVGADPTVLSTVALAKLCQQHMRSGSNIIETAPRSAEMAACRAASFESGLRETPNSIAEMAGSLLSPKNQAATARAAANGKLMAGLNGRIAYTDDILNGKQMFNTEFKDCMVRRGGSVVKQRTEVKVPGKKPLAAFALHGEAPDPLAAEAPQKQKQQRAPRRQQPSKAPRTHVAGSDGTIGKVL